MGNEVSIPADLKKEAAKLGGALGVEEKLPVAAPKPRLIVVGGSSSAERKQEFGVGSAVVMPDGITVVNGIGPTTPVTPLFRWLSWAQVRDRLDVSDFWLKEETTDIEHPIAVAARSPSTRVSDYEDGQTDKDGRPLRWKFVENINFVLHFPEFNTAAVATWAKGGHRYGANLNRYLERRALPIFYNVVDLHVATAKNKSGDDWEQLMWKEAPVPFVEDKALRQVYLGEYETLRDQFKAAGGVKVADVE